MADEILTVKPRQVGIHFGRTKVRDESWYQRAAERFWRAWTRKRGYVFAKPTAYLEREPEFRCWVVYLHCDAVELPGAIAGTRLEINHV